MEGWGGGGGGLFSYLILFQGLSFLHLEITLLFAKLCYAFEEKPQFYEKSYSKLSKNEPENIPESV